MDHVAAALEDADARRQVVDIIGLELEPRERAGVVQLGAKLDRLELVGDLRLRGLRDGTDGVPAVADLNMLFDAPEVTLRREGVLRVLAGLAFRLLELRSERRDVVHRPLELHEHRVRARVGLEADLGAHAGGRRTTGRAIAPMELPCERRPDQHAGPDAGRQ